MATFTSTSAPDSSPGARLTYRTITPSASYAAGGETVLPGDVGLKAIWGASLNITGASAAAVVNASYNRAPSKVMLWTATAELANAVNASAVTVDAVFFGPSS